MMRITVLAGTHDRRGFDCGRPELNAWLVRIARQHQDKRLSKTFVAVADDTPERILGYYALTLTEVDTRELPSERARKLPRIVPGVRLGRLAVDLRYQGRGLGELLLMDAMGMRWSEYAPFASTPGPSGYSSTPWTSGLPISIDAMVQSPLPMHR
jgi:GNAT superfamily N-acetyltransferase